jgi:hypothetical protein
MSVTSGSARNRMAHQMLSDKPLKEFEQTFSTFAMGTIVNSNHALNSVAIHIFPTNAYAKQKKYIRQGMWKPKILMVRNVYSRICELNTQLVASYPNQTGLLPEDEMKLAFINLCLPNWQQEILKTGINKYYLTWPEILSKVEALEQAEVAIAELVSAKETKPDREEGEIQPTKPSSKKKAKTSFFCKVHGPDQRHNTNGCKVINAKIEKLKGQKPSFNNNST